MQCLLKDRNSIIEGYFAVIYYNSWLLNHKTIKYFKYLNIRITKLKINQTVLMYDEGALDICSHWPNVNSFSQVRLQSKKINKANSTS